MSYFLCTKCGTRNHQDEKSYTLHLKNKERDNLFKMQIFHYTLQILYYTLQMSPNNHFKLF